MKLKNILFSSLILLFMTGCGSKSINLDLEKVEIELNNLEITEDGEKIKLFENNLKMDEEKMQDKYNLNTDFFDEILISTSAQLDTASMYAIFLPKKDKEEDAKKEIDDFFVKYDQAWTMGYFPEEEQLVKNRSNEKYGNYYIYVISKDNEKVMEKIKNIK